MLFNVVYILQSIWYIKWYRNDCVETRRNLKKGYFLVFLQTLVLYTVLFIIFYYMPPSMLPDKYEDNYGNEYEFPPEEKEDMRYFALYFTAFFGIIFTTVNLYLYLVVKRWAKPEYLMEQLR